jgi:hypothetical protein
MFNLTVLNVLPHSPKGSSSPPHSTRAPQFDPIRIGLVECLPPFNLKGRAYHPAKLGLRWLTPYRLGLLSTPLRSTLGVEWLTLFELGTLSALPLLNLRFRTYNPRSKMGFCLWLTLWNLCTFLTYIKLFLWKLVFLKLSLYYVLFWKPCSQSSSSYPQLELCMIKHYCHRR